MSYSEVTKMQNDILKKMGKHSYLAFIRSLGYDVIKYNKDKYILRKKTIENKHLVKIDLGIFNRNRLLREVIKQGHDFTEFLTQEEPDYFNMIKGDNNPVKSPSLIKEYPTPKCI